MAGTRLFLSGEIAYASDVNTFLMDQVIARFADVTERGLAFGDGIAINNGGDGKPILSAGQFCYLIDRGDGFGEVQYWDGNSWESASQFAIADGQITTAKIATGAVTSSKIAANSIDSSHIAAGTVIASDIDDLAITTAKINDLAVTTGKIADLNITTGKIADLNVTSAKLASHASTDGSRAVTTDHIRNEAVTSAKIATAVAGNGLSGGAGTALAVNVDDSTVEINTDALRVKDGGITSVKLGSSLSLTGSTSLQQVLEKATVSGSALSSITYLDALSGAVYYNTASTTSNITLDLRGDGSNTLASLVPAGKAFSCVFMITSGHVNGKILTVTAGSSTVALKWFGGNVSPAGSSGGSVDVYTITAVKTSETGNGTFAVFISQSKFA